MVLEKQIFCRVVSFSKKPHGDLSPELLQKAVTAVITVTLMRFQALESLKTAVTACLATIRHLVQAGHEAAARILKEPPQLENEVIAGAGRFARRCWPRICEHPPTRRGSERSGPIRSPSGWGSWRRSSFRKGWPHRLAPILPHRVVYFS